MTSSSQDTCARVGQKRYSNADNAGPLRDQRCCKFHCGAVLRAVHRYGRVWLSGGQVWATGNLHLLASVVHCSQSGHGVPTTALGVNLWRFIAGIGIGVELVTIGTYLTELVPKEIRAGPSRAVRLSAFRLCRVAFLRTCSSRSIRSGLTAGVGSS